MKYLIKEGFDINDEVKVTYDYSANLELFKKDVEYILNDMDKIILKEESSEDSQKSH